MKRFTKTQIEQIAKSCHEVNKSFCESLGDLSTILQDGDLVFVSTCEHELTVVGHQLVYL